ncbi:MAG: hypothetical protein GBAus27B_000275 [Mycoplasmataceae bacterium]|nr:MAG: hypothetical protein GBAus27B_000275 [Mycoplasmataceae bacterium]
MDFKNKKTKNKSENSNNHDHDNNNENKENNQSSIKNFLLEKIAPFLIFSAVGYTLYKFQIISKITNLFKRNKGKERATETQDPSASKSQDQAI